MYVVISNTICYSLLRISMEVENHLYCRQIEDFFKIKAKRCNFNNFNRPQPLLFTWVFATQTHHIHVSSWEFAHNQRWLYIATPSLIGWAYTQDNPWGPFYKHGLTLIWARITNHMLSKVPDGITYLFMIFNSCTIVWEWISNCISHIIIDVITYPYWDFSKTMLLKATPDICLSPVLACLLFDTMLFHRGSFTDRH